MHYFGGEVEFIYIPVCNKDDRYIFPCYKDDKGKHKHLITISMLPVCNKDDRYIFTCYKDDKGKHKHLITISMFNHIPQWSCFINKTCECP